MSELVLVDSRDGVCVVTLNRPEARNALDSALHRASAEALWAAEHDDGVDVVILTGADPAFCAGLDLRELGAGGSNLRGGEPDGQGAPGNPIQAVWRMTKPVVGAINGAAVTGGFELALACDFLVASVRATFADTHARVGVTPGGGMSVFLPMAVGARMAKELTLSGRFVDAHEAFRLGLVNHVVPHEQLLDLTRGIARDIAANDRPTVRHLKDLYDHTTRLAPGDGLALEQQVFRDYRVDYAEVERRRAAVVARGREQQR